MTQQKRRAPRLRANLARSGTGLGLAPRSRFLCFGRRAKTQKSQVYRHLHCLQNSDLADNSTSINIQIS